MRFICLRILTKADFYCKLKCEAFFVETEDILRYRVGDMIVYPMHGAGIIEKIEEHDMLGEKNTYYVMYIPFGDMRIMIPINNLEEIGIRDVASAEVFDTVLFEMKQGISKMNENWNKRYRANMEKLKSGDIMQVAEVVRNLMITDKEKKLSTGERKMLSNAKQILVSELMCAKGIDLDCANELIICAVSNDA